MKAATVVLLLAFAIIGINIASAQSNYCPEPKVNDQVIPKQYFYKHGQSVRVGHPLKYFLRCMNGKWKPGISSPILYAYYFCFYRLRTTKEVTKPLNRNITAYYDNCT